MEGGNIYEVDSVSFTKKMCNSFRETPHPPQAVPLPPLGKAFLLKPLSLQRLFFLHFDLLRQPLF